MKAPAIVMIVFSTILFTSCEQAIDNPVGKDGWLKGNKKEKFEIVTNHLRGFDMAMVETGYRYQELYWAGKDKNWQYADYQINKIRLTIENGLERRPKRAQSAQSFLNTVLPEMQKAVNSKDPVLFNKNFLFLTESCNSCHAQEEVPFFNVTPPTNRQSSIKK